MYNKLHIYIYIYIYIYMYIYDDDDDDDVWHFVTPWTVARLVPLSMEFSRQEYRSGYLFCSPWDFPNQGIEPGFPALQADSLPSLWPGKPIYDNIDYQLKRGELYFILHYSMYNIICVYLCGSCSVISDSAIFTECSPPGSSLHGIFQARTLEWVAILFSRESSWSKD